MLFGRMPRLEQIVMELHIIDGLDGSFRIRVGGEQYAFGIGVKLDGLKQRFDPVHLGHAMIHQQQCDWLVALK